jgi:hypothetical protein
MIAWIESSSMPISGWAMLPAGFAFVGESSPVRKRHLTMPTSCAWPGRFSRRLRAWAAENKIPIRDCQVGEAKHKIGEEFLRNTTVQEGLFLILVSRAPAPVWDVHPNRRITRKKPAAYVNHYSFHILDRDWGHITIKISGHPRFRRK